MEVFFYGLFMDESILEKNGLHPSNPRKCYLPDYTLKIGSRASLIPCDHERSYGLLFSVDEKAIHSLYAEASVADYIPEEVEIVTDSNHAVPAICYNLPASSLSGTNTAYARSLLELAESLEFPESYLEKINSMANTHDE